MEKTIIEDYSEYNPFRGKYLQLFHLAVILHNF